jgi:hypothetical protein
MVDSGIKQSKRLVIHSTEAVQTVMGITLTKHAASPAATNKASGLLAES